MSGKNVDKLRNVVKDIIAEGYPIVALLTQIHDEVLNKTDLTDVNKSLINEKIAMASLLIDIM